MKGCFPEMQGNSTLGLHLLFEEYHHLALTHGARRVTPPDFLSQPTVAVLVRRSVLPREQVSDY